MDVIPTFVDLGAFASRSFTATDFFAVFPDFAAFFFVLAMCSPDATRAFAFAAAFARLGALATAVPFFLVASAILAQRVGPLCRSVSHPRDERVP